MIVNFFFIQYLSSSYSQLNCLYTTIVSDTTACTCMHIYHTVTLPQYYKWLPHNTYYCTELFQDMKHRWHILEFQTVHACGVLNCSNKHTSADLGVLIKGGLQLREAATCNNQVKLGFISSPALLPSLVQFLGFPLGLLMVHSR